MNTLKARRRALENQLAELRKARGAATLDGGRKFDSSAITALEQEIASLLEAEGEQARREREASEGPERERQAKLRAQYSDEAAAYFAEVERAEQAARTLAASIKTALAHADTMRAALAGSRRKPQIIGANEIADRLSWRLSWLLKDIVHPGRFGKLKLDVGALGMRAAVESWAEAEQRAIGLPEEKRAAA